MSIYVPIRMASLKTSAEWNIQPEYTAAPLCCWFIRYTELILMQPAVHTVFMKVIVTVSFCWGVSCIYSYLIHVNGVDTLHLFACVCTHVPASVTMWSQYQPFYLWTVSICVFPGTRLEQMFMHCSSVLYCGSGSRVYCRKHSVTGAIHHFVYPGGERLALFTP